MSNMSDHAIRKGLDIPIQGAASGDIVALDAPSTVAYDPRELSGLIPRLDAREGDRVAAGGVLFHDKKRPSIVVRSPIAGVVKEVRRGARRVITDVVVEADGDASESLQAYTPAELNGLSREEAREAVAASGWWPALRTRPLDRIPSPDDTPQSILIGAMETGPLQPGADVLIDAGDADALQAAINVLARLTDGPVHLARKKGEAHPALDGVSGVQVHTFSGPHPAGDMGVQVNLVDPPRGTHRVWVIRAWDAVALGHTLLKGRFHAERVYAAVGVGAADKRFVKTVLGAPLETITSESTPSRWINGSVLTGRATSKDRWAGFGNRGVHLLPEEVPRHILGWALPAPGAWSFHKAFLGAFTGAPKGGVDLRPGLFGGHRAIVPIGVYDKVVPTPDILPDFLFKAIIAGDLEESISLGLLDITREEAALCTYVCPSKMEFDVILQEGLEFYEREA
jgi:Na+-transporting NADH:ubiquinone oxidoreductase subunit A